MNAVAVAISAAAAASVAQGNELMPLPLGLEARLQKPWKILLLFSMMKNAMRFILATGMAWSMYGPTDVCISLVLWFFLPDGWIHYAAPLQELGGTVPLNALVLVHFYSFVYLVFTFHVVGCHRWDYKIIFTFVVVHYNSRLLWGTGCRLSLSLSPSLPPSLSPCCWNSSLVAAVVEIQTWLLISFSLDGFKGDILCGISIKL